MDREGWKERHSYHKVSGRTTTPRPARRRVAFFVLPMFIILYFFNSNAYISRIANNADDTAPESHSPAASTASSAEGIKASPEQVRSVIDSFASGSWGQETVDSAQVLSAALERQSDEPYATSTAIYLWLLVTRAPLEQANDMLLTQVGRYLGDVEGDTAPDDVLEQYRIALRNVQS